jgi:hypothetical protein
MDVSNDIADIENEIDALAEAAERCQKIMIVARFAIAAGGIIVATLVLGLVRPDALVLLSSITGILAGIALYGSHRSTLEDFRNRIAAHEAHRSNLIDAMDLPVVERS